MLSSDAGWEEWWRFTLEDEPFPDTYFTFPVNSDSLSSGADSTDESTEGISFVTFQTEEDEQELDDAA